jgi:GR25 family glycosyltransferase involved in LPS biosynthesis
MKVYVLHSSNLSKRKKHILEQFRKHNIYNFEFIEKFDAREITEEESRPFAKDYKRTVMSLFLKHIYVYQLIAKDSEASEATALIFEDDVILGDDFYEILEKYMNEACDARYTSDANAANGVSDVGDTSDANAANGVSDVGYARDTSEYDMLFIGCGYNLHINKEVIEDDKHIYKNPYTRATDSYVITSSCAKKICDYYEAAKAATLMGAAAATAGAACPITLPINLWLNKAILDKGLNVYWCEPTIVSQGSQSGLFEISL